MRLTTAVVITSLIGSSRLPSQELEPRSTPPLGLHVYTFRSPSMGNLYEISVGVPAAARAAKDKKFPAIVVTDAGLALPAALYATRTLAGQDSIPPIIVIGIGPPPEEGDTADTRRRVYEFSTGDWAMTDPFGALVSRLCKQYHAPPDRCVGGAPKYLDFIVSEVLPRVIAKYPIDREQLALFGVSAGGYFASYAIFQDASPFSTYIISSPAMAYGDGEIFRIEERYAKAHKDLNAAIYLASGSLEIDDPFLEGVGKIVSGQAHFSAVLRSRKYPSLKLYSEVHHGLGHADAAGTTLVRGIRALYGSSASSHAKVAR